MSHSIRFLLRAALPAAITLAVSAADFTYTDRTEVTGGSLKSVMNLAARFSKQAGGNATTIHRFKDQKMGTFTGEQISITDLKAETITAIDTGKKEYSVITFAEMAEAMKAMAAKMSGAKPQKSDNDVKMDWKFSADNTGKTKEVAGVTAKHTIVKLESEMTDTKSGQSGKTGIAIDIWSGKVAGYEAVQNFQKEMAKKLAMSANMNPMMMAQMGEAMIKGMGEASKKMAEMEGMPLETVTRMGAGAPVAASEAPAPAAQENQPKASEAISGALGRLGGFGRFGRGKDKKAEEPPPAAQQPGQAPAGGAVLLETTTTVVSFSSDPIDPSLLQVPAGFKQVEHPMKKMR
jgi:hypothetical protein